MPNNKSKSKKRVKRKPARQPGGRGRVMISECAEHYAYALSSPFRAYNEGIGEVCVPDNSLLPSFKFSSPIRGTFETGTANYGYCAMSSSAPASNTNTVQHSSAASTGGAATVLSSFIGLQYAAPVAFPYTTSSLASGDKEQRTVACGLRVRYVGKELDRGGMLYAYRQPGDVSVNALTPQDIMASLNTRSYPIGKDWVTLTWSPVTARDFQYTTDITTVMDLVILAHSAVPGAVFQFEVVYFMECVGIDSFNATPTHSDPNGMAAAQQIAQHGNYTYQGEGWSLGEVVRRTAEAIRGASHFIAGHGDDLRTIAGAGMAGARLLRY